MSDSIKAEAEEFLSVLGERVAELNSGDMIAPGGDDAIDFTTYQNFREKMSECLSFLIIIERRIDDLEEEDQTPLRESFNQKSAELWSGLLDLSLQYLNAICQRDRLPIGTRYVFTQELNTLNDAERVLAMSSIECHLDDQAKKYRDKANLILSEIVGKAPQMLKISK